LIVIAKVDAISLDFSQIFDLVRSPPVAGHLGSDPPGRKLSRLTNPDPAAAESAPLFAFLTQLGGGQTIFRISNSQTHRISGVFGAKRLVDVSARPNTCTAETGAGEGVISKTLFGCVW
jgi:hypothetical protein